MTTKHILPVPDWCVESQSFDEHIQRAKNNNQCWNPGPCASGIYYYGGEDLAPPTARRNERIVVTASAPGKFFREDQGSKGYGKNGRIFTDDNQVIILAHLESFLFPNGTRIQAGDQVGVMGSTGNSTGKHVHWEVRAGGINGVPIDPMKLLEGAEEPDPTIYAGMLELQLTDKFRIIDGPLRKRSEPSTKGGQSTIVGTLAKGAIVTPVRALMDGAWLDLGDGVFCAWINGGYVYAERVK
jgi:hypothetical protein